MVVVISKGVWLLFLCVCPSSVPLSVEHQHVIWTARPKQLFPDQADSSLYHPHPPTSLRSVSRGLPSVWIVLIALIEQVFSNIGFVCLFCFVWFVFLRWDIQRIREQRILQRLQLRMYKKKGIQESEPEVTSFFPEPDDGKFCLSKRAGFSKKENDARFQGTTCSE